MALRAVNMMAKNVTKVAGTLTGASLGQEMSRDYQQAP